MIDLRAEWEAAKAALDPADRARLTPLGVLARDVDRLVGAADIRLCGADLYEPDPDGTRCLITPVRVELALTPESVAPAVYCRIGQIVDLIGWHPARPDRWALRVGAAEWLGCIEPQFLEPSPVPTWRTPLAWLQALCTGLVLLSDEPLSRYRILSGCISGLVAEDHDHAAELRAILERPFEAPAIIIGRKQRAAA
jgi:hypothetical protein